jgi:hypothetical protein
MRILEQHMSLRRIGSLGIGILAGLALALAPRAAAASSIEMYGYSGTSHNTYPCIFAGNSGCPQNPSAWPAPAGSTTNDWGNSDQTALVTLTKTYTGADLSSWMTYVGSSFVLGLDFNSDSSHGQLSVLTIDFRDTNGSQLGYWYLPAPTVTPDIHNGTGKWDYSFAAGCVGTLGSITASDNSQQTTCSQYAPFVIPGGTATMKFEFGYVHRDDGDDDLFAVPYAATAVPEPASFVLLITGLLLVAKQLRRRV